MTEPSLDESTEIICKKSVFVIGMSARIWWLGQKTSVEGVASTPQLSTGVVADSSDSFIMISKTVDTEVNYK